VSPTYSDKIILSVHKDSSPKSFSPIDQTTDKQLNVNSWKHVAGNDITFPLHCHNMLHVYFTQCIAACTLCNLHANQHGFHGTLKHVITVTVLLESERYEACCVQQ
jgi:hypothetical protein